MSQKESEDQDAEILRALQKTQHDVSYLDAGVI